MHVPDSDPGCAYAAFERAVEPLHSAFSSFRPLNSSFPRRRESRGEVRIVAMTLELSHQPMHPNFHTLVCRRQPARTIAMRIDSRYLFRQSGEGRNPEGEGRGKTSIR